MLVGWPAIERPRPRHDDRVSIHAYREQLAYAADDGSGQLALGAADRVPADVVAPDSVALVPEREREPSQPCVGALLRCAGMRSSPW